MEQKPAGTPENSSPGSRQQGLQSRLPISHRDVPMRLPSQAPQTDGVKWTRGLRWNCPSCWHTCWGSNRGWSTGAGGKPTWSRLCLCSRETCVQETSQQLQFPRSRVKRRGSGRDSQKPRLAVKKGLCQTSRPQWGRVRAVSTGPGVGAAKEPASTCSLNKTDTHAVLGRGAGLQIP